MPLEITHLVIQFVSMVQEEFYLISKFKQMGDNCSITSEPLCEREVFCVRFPFRHTVVKKGRVFSGFPLIVLTIFTDSSSTDCRHRSICFTASCSLWMQLMAVVASVQMPTHLDQSRLFFHKKLIK
ncbi:hypothetical protein ATANTOWER_016577 [Ataeniobius toweri]|uniref:Uncharacterized protein n=1 Tax=Ataeniobius toweri TaxID=208326 RepID=A0ABU7BHZ3_9TELE|nr:hypothetical protein [Ataeniobius toweri]